MADKKDKLAKSLAEKHFHSRGAASYEEGRFDQAIRFFKKALALEEHAYTRYHLSLSYLAKGKLDAALKEITRAIELVPTCAEYYGQRSAMQRLKGDALKGDEDEARAAGLDADFPRISRIRVALEAVRRSFNPPPPIEGCGRQHPENGELRAIVEGIRVSINGARVAPSTGKACGASPSRKGRVAAARLPVRALRDWDLWAAAITERSCIIASCPAYCCHFSGETVLHGLSIGPWKLQAIRRYLREKGLSEEGLLGKLPFGPEEERLRLIPPHFVVKAAGARVVFYPGRKGKPLGKERLKGLPRTLDFREPAWITADAEACAFLTGGRCMIHDLGDEPALHTCKEFLCFTAYVFLILDHLGLLENRGALARPMEKLNALAVEGILLLSERLYGNEKLCRIEAAMQDALKDALDADVQKDHRREAALLARYRELEKKHARMLARQSALLKEDVEKLLDG